MHALAANPLMTRNLSLTLALLLAYAFPIAAQTHFTRGEVVVSGYRDDTEVVDGQTVAYVRSNVRVHAADGSFTRELVTSTTRRFREPLVFNDTAYVPTRTPDAIARFAADGTELTPFTTQVARVNYLSPGRNGGIIAANVSGEVYGFSADGTLTTFRDFTTDPVVYGGVDLGDDGCTLFFATSGAIGRWDICRNTPLRLLAPPVAGASDAFRLLPDGSFLVAVIQGGPRVLHVASNGSTILRTYLIPATALALDVDGTSFWTNAGNILVKVDIATGTILSSTFTEFHIEGISVVGEPRAAFAGAAAAAIPTITPPVLIAFGLAIATIATLRLRTF